MHLFRSLRVFTTALVLYGLAGLAASRGQVPPPAYTVANAHSHNDYEQPRPFHAAYELGFGSVEADVFLKEGELYVAHNWKDITPERTFRALYLEPILKKTGENNGWPYPNRRELQLLIDLKNTGAETLAALQKQLAPHRGELRHVRIVISGDMPAPDAMPGQDAIFTFDGRKNLVYSPEASARVVLVSSSIADFGGGWDGKSTMPEAMKQKVADFIKTQHARNKLVRLWATPNTDLGYQTLKELGVDYIGTDDLAGLVEFLKK